MAAKKNRKPEPCEIFIRGKGEQKEAAGGYRSRRPEKVPVERELRGGGKQKETA